MLKTIESKDTLVYPATVENLLKLEHCIELKAYAKGSKITFLLDIPVIRKETYSYYKILPLPTINNHNQITLIIPEHPYILVNGSKTEPVATPCTEIEEGLFLCQEDKILTLTPDRCVADLMKFNSNINSCHPMVANIKGVKIEALQQNQWLIFTKDPLTLKRFCETGVTQHKIQGAYILTLEDSCKVKIKDIRLSQHLIKGNDVTVTKLPIINLPEIVMPTPLPEKKSLNLDGVNLADLQFLRYALQKSDSEIVEGSNESIVKVKGISVWTLGLYIILVLGTCVIIFVKYKKIECFQNHQSQTHPTEDFELAEGRVMYAGSRPVTVNT
jgi:hypothetical protein